NTGGGTGVTLQQVFAVAGTCYFTAGRITSSSTNLLIFNDNAIASGANNNVSNPSYVNGPVRKIGNDAFTFPVGKSNVGYMLCAISAPSNTSDAFTAEYFRNSASALGPITAVGLYRVSACEYWQLDRTSGSSSVNVTLSWSGLSPCNASAYVNSLASLVVAHFNGTSWNTYGNSGGTTGNGAAGTVTWNNVSVFSPFTLGSTSAVANPLPIKFTDVKAYKVNAGNKIEWKNLTEENIERYEIERSANGTIFTSISSVNPKSNNGLEQSYAVTDENILSGTNFYRIKGIEISGSFVYSTIVKVVPDGNTKEYVSVFPNPVSGNQFTVQLNNYDRGTYSLQLINTSGQRVMTKSLKHAGGSASVSIERPDAVNAGVYILQVTGENKIENIKLVIK
ncbi:MAG: T9SS type A sorting domain-containing protein, partial [Chitinophagaceae bacterium]|nr:T9SS type A sorting domain-containing protein [Chitinophagaceae bacterium]